ncbi:uncharacterized protein BP5553_04662 [Venustampulla echinocandica]|uniref:Uncharacterized protein n=1 Tax=Venustampulla echinocandica TaxID=2656787 RepID=A0A370TNY0_9HELO|nr:uncharacterized protein BP5553_04662 [Venustampulla echinocandica]RDL37229.1 hypothetical protein BP5553_04662 [Venustampulla echinocandica]
MSFYRLYICSKRDPTCFTVAVIDVWPQRILVSIRISGSAPQLEDTRRGPGGVLDPEDKPNSERFEMRMSNAMYGMLDVKFAKLGGLLTALVV